MEVFRPRSWMALMRGAAVLFLAFSIVSAVQGPGPDPGPEDYVGMVIFGMLSFAGFWRASRMRLEASDTGVTVYGYFSDASASWSRIQGFEVSYNGLYVICSDDRYIRATGLGKSNWKAWAGRRSRNEDIADHLASLRDQYGQPGEPAAP